MTIVNASAVSPCPPMKMKPNSVEYQCGFDRHDPVDRRGGRRERVEDDAAAAHVLDAKVRAHVPFVLPAGEARERPRECDPAAEVDQGAHQEKPGIQVDGLVPEHFVLLDQVRMGPGIEAAHPQHDRQKEQRHQRQCPARRFEDPAEDAPRATRQVLDHQQRQRAERDPQEQQVGNQPRPEKMAAIEDESQRAGRQADASGHERARAARVDVGGRRVGRVRHHRGS